MRRFAGNQEMEKNTMTTYRAPLALMLGTFAMFGCWQQLDQGASAGVTSVAVNTKDGLGAKFPEMTTTPAIGETAADNGDPSTFAANGCAKDEFDTQTALNTYCQNCHEGGSNGNFQGVADIMTLVNKPASAKYPAGTMFIVPGDPANSLIFKRITALEMPPPTSDVTNPIPHPTISDMSVLQQWIMCLNSTSTPAPAAN